MGLVEGNFGGVGRLLGEVGGGVDDGMVAPGADGVEIGHEVGRELGGDGLAGQLFGEDVGEVFEHGEADQKRVARRPRSGGKAEDTELNGQMGLLDGHGGVDALGVELELMELIGWKDGEGAVGGGAELKEALRGVVGEELGAEDLGEGAGGVAAKGLHLPEAVLGGYKSLGDDEIVNAGGADVGDAVGVAGDGNSCGEGGERERAIDLGQRCVDGVTHPEARAEEGCDGEQDERDEDESDDLVAFEALVAAAAAEEVVEGDGATVAGMRGIW